MQDKKNYQQRPGLPTYASNVKRYGAMIALPPARSTDVPPPRDGVVKHINICGGLAICLGPWLLFTVNCWCFTFRIRYEHPSINLFVAFCGAALVCMSLGLALQARRRRALNGKVPEATWNTLLFLTTLAAWLLGMGVGEAMFQSTMKPYYDLSSLNFYASVDVAKTSGSQLLDAGIISFIKGSQLDRNQAARYGNGTIYCVAPIISPVPVSADTSGSGLNGSTVSSASGTVREKLASYDFWAVGTDCCDGPNQMFSCGAYDDPYARAGIRSLSQELNSQYKMAVTQSMAKFGISAPNPIFLTWMQDPTATVSSYEDNTWQRFVYASLTFLVIQLFFVAVVLYSLMKLNHEDNTWQRLLCTCITFLVIELFLVTVVLYSLMKLNH